jgi:hypothetical protein
VGVEDLELDGADCDLEIHEANAVIRQGVQRKRNAEQAKKVLTSRRSEVPLPPKPAGGNRRAVNTAAEKRLMP